MIGRGSAKIICATVALSASAVLLLNVPCWAMRARGNVFLLAGEKAPYGISEGGDYGEQKRVTSRGQAQKILEEYFAGKNVKVGGITEKELYFEAEVRDAGGKLVDKVIIDKRSGRIRSIY